MAFPALIVRLTDIRNQLAKVDSEIPTIAGSRDQEVERMLDSIAENAVHLRGVITYGLGPDRRIRPAAVRLMKRVRKALGYSYP